jgi:hypothetical protein
VRRRARLGPPPRGGPFPGSLGGPSAVVRRDVRGRHARASAASGVAGRSTLPSA